MNEVDSGYARLEDQIAWLDRRSSYHQSWYRRLKVVSIAAAALVPLAGSFAGFLPVAGLLGVLVVIAEGLQHIGQHHENWIRYRATCEDLRHEKYLYLARAKPYAACSDEDAFKRLAENVEALLAREGGEWLRIRRHLDQPEKD